MTILLVTSNLTTCSEHSIHYVKTTPDASCPADPCLTLSQYAQQPYHYLTSNTTLLLLPGNHVLSVNFTVKKVSDFEIRSALLSSPAESQVVKIVCKGFVGFTFRNISKLAFHSLTFDSCGKGSVEYSRLTNSADYQTAYGIFVHSGEHTKITNCSFQENVSLDLRGSNSFMNNCRCSNRNHTCICLGGGIHANTSILLFNGNNSFRDNLAEFGGGMFAYYSTVTFNGYSTFRNNSAEVNAEGLFVWHSTVNFSGNCTFTDSSAKQDAGGIQLWYSNVMASGIINFRNNAAKRFGGGIKVLNTTLHFVGDTILKGSSADFGGGIFAYYSTVTFNGYSSFRNNSAEVDAGGAMVIKSSVNFSGVCTFSDNSAKRLAGGIRTW